MQICDFGLARLRDMTRSMTGNCGTVQWMAPEVLSNQQYSEAADVYSFAIVFWEMFTAKCPFEQLSQVQVAVEVAHKGTRPEIPAFVPPDVQAIMHACWAQDWTQRPSATQLLAQLRAVMPTHYGPKNHHHR